MLRMDRWAGAAAPLESHPGALSGSHAADEAASTRKSLVQTALRLARERGGWDKVHLHELARESGLGLDAVSRHFRDKDELADGCFDEADCALRNTANEPGWAQRHP